VRVVDAARIPKRPYKPDLAINTALGLMGGLCLGVGVRHHAVSARIARSNSRATLLSI